MRKMFSLLFLLVIASLVLSACGAPAPVVYQTDSKLICPKVFDPGRSVCRTAANDQEVYDTVNEMLYDAVYVGTDQVAVYKKSTETFDLYRGPGYFPTPSSYAYIYPTGNFIVTSDIDPNACGGYDEVDCVGPLGDVLLKGPTVFDSSYSLTVVFNTNNPKVYADLYTYKGYVAFMSQHFNSDVRDALRDSNSIDPTPWLTAEKSKSDMEPIWLKQLTTHNKLDPYREIATVTKITVRYFQPAKVEDGDPQQENAVTEEQNFNKMLDRREKFCGEFEKGSDARNNCFKIFACFENGKFCDNAADGIVSFFNPSDFSPVP